MRMGDTEHPQKADSGKNYLEQVRGKAEKLDALRKRRRLIRIIVILAVITAAVTTISLIMPCIA